VQFFEMFWQVNMMKKIFLMWGIILVLTAMIFLLFQKEVEVKKAPQHETEEKNQEISKEYSETEDEIEIVYVDKTILNSLENVQVGSVIDKERLKEKKERYLTYSEIDDQVLARIQGKSYPEGALISLDELRYIKVLHYNYNHEIQVGELIVHREIADECVNIFRELFEIEYEIESMRLIDDFWTGDSVDSDTESIANNNTSSFNYRVVPGTSRLSNHAKGRAIDINPLQNPYVKYNSDGSFAHYYRDMELYLDRKSGKEHMITHQDDCYKIFKKYGFTWGGDWNSVKDYQHFEKE